HVGVFGAAAALGRSQPAALGGDRAALDTVRRGELDVDHVAAHILQLVDAGGAHRHPGRADLAGDAGADADVVRAVVATPVPREEDARELVEREPAIRLRVAAPL